jgi:hypothetical protein
LTPAVDELAERVLARAAAASHRATLGLGGCQFEVACDSPGPIAAAREFFLWDRAADAAPTAYSVSAIVDEPSVRAIGEAVKSATPDAVLETFAGECFQARYDGRGARVFVETGVHAVRGYVIVQRQRQIVVVRASDDPRYHTYLVRCMREICLREGENRGGGNLHAACFVRDQVATLIVGGKGAGKTSFVLAMSSQPGCEFLANDRVILTPADGHVVATTFPLACRIGLGTIESSERLRPIFARRERLTRVQHEAVLKASDEARRFASSAKLELTQRELVDEVGFRHAQSARVGRVIFPELGSASQPIGVLVPRDQALARLRAEAQTPREEKWITPWLVDRRKDDAALEQQMLALFQTLLERAPAVHVRCSFDNVGAAQPDQRLMAAMERA